MIQKTTVSNFYKVIFWYLLFISQAQATDSADIGKIIRSMIRQSDMADLTPFVAPKFISYLDLYKIYFSLLTETMAVVDSDKLLRISDDAQEYLTNKPDIILVLPPTIIVDILKEYFWHEFPHGKPSYEELEILSSMGAKLLITRAIDISIFAMPKESYQSFICSKSFLYEKKVNDDWLVWKPKYIAHAITMRDVYLMHLADFGEMNKYVDNPDGHSRVKDIFAVTDKTTMWLMYQWLSANEKKFNKAIKQITKVMGELYALNNIHGVMIFVQSLKSSCVSLLLEKRISNNKLEVINKFSEILSTSNYNEFLVKMTRNDIYLPILPVVFQKLMTTELPKKNPKEADIARMANAFRQVSLCKRQGRYRLPVNKYIFDFFNALPAVDDDVEKILSKKPDAQEVKKMQEPAPELDGPADFAAYVSDHAGPQAVEHLFAAKVFTLHDLQGLLEGASREQRNSLLISLGLSAKDASNVSALAFLSKN